VLRFAILCLVLLAAYLGAAKVRRLAEPAPSPYCRGGEILAGVYHPDRLRLRSACRVAVGTVSAVAFEEFDGDVHLKLAVDPADRGLLASGNRDGELVVEVIPQDRSAVPVPRVGERVTVVGPWVEDTRHGWNEIHPAWWISAGRLVPASVRELRRAQLLLTGGEEGGDEG
jgi:hypothetical protein